VAVADELERFVLDRPGDAEHFTTIASGHRGTRTAFFAANAVGSDTRP
jgi:hypothetical protein